MYCMCIMHHDTLYTMEFGYSIEKQTVKFTTHKHYQESLEKSHFFEAAKLQQRILNDITFANYSHTRMLIAIATRSLTDL